MTNTVHDIGIVRCDDGVDWSDYLESIFDEKDSGPYDVSIFSIGKDGIMRPINQHHDENDSPTNPPSFKFVVVVVTPDLIRMFHEFRSLGFWNFDQSTTRKTLFLCGIETVQLFETDDAGRTLSERFKDYSSWTKYSHENFDKLVDSAVAWIRSEDPVIPGRKDLKIILTGPDKKDNSNDDDDDDNDSDGDYIFMQKPPSDEDKSSKTSFKIVRDSNSSGEIDEYIGKREASIGERTTLYADTYGIGPSRTNSRKNQETKVQPNLLLDEFSIVPSEASCEDNTTIVVIFKDPPLEKCSATGSHNRKRDFKISMTDESCMRSLDLMWINSNVAYFIAPIHHPGIVQIKVASNADDKYKTVVDLEYKRSQGVEELVSEVSQIYIHLLSISLCKSPSSSSPTSSSGSFRGSLLTPSPSLNWMDRNLSNVFRDSNDIDQFNVRAFEYFFGACHHVEESTTHLPTCLHLVAKHNLPQLAAAFLGLPDSIYALSIHNSSKMTPIDLARSLGHSEVVTLFEEFLNSGSISSDLTSSQKAIFEDQYIDMEQNKSRNPKLKTKETRFDNSDEIDENDPLNRGAFDKSQEELLKIMDLFKKKDISMSDVQTLFREWQLRHPNNQNKQTMQELFLMPSKPEESKGLKKTIGNWFGSGSKKSPNFDGSLKNSKKQNPRISSSTDNNELPSIPPRTIDDDKSKSSIPPPPRKTYNDYLSLVDSPDDSDTSDSVPDRPPRRTPLKNTKQSSFPTQLNPPPFHAYPRKCSLPETGNRLRVLQHFNSRLDSTTEISESTSALDKGSHGYISMSSRGKLNKN